MKKILALVFALIMIACVPAMAASISFPMKVGFLHPEESYTLTPKLNGVKSSELVWKSSDDAIVSVVNGKLTANKVGLCVIRATNGNKKADVGVVVLPGAITLMVGETYQLPYNKILSYASKNSKIAKVSKKGVVTATAAGETLVGVKYGKTIGTVTVNVVSSGTEQSAAAQLSCANETDQIVLVEYQGGSKAKVSFHECVDGVWTEVYTTSGYVGSNGIGKTAEGDKKTPTGTYNLTTPFGIKSDPGAAQSYTMLTKYHYWCGTSGTDYYNQLVDTRVTKRARTSSDEYLINMVGYYNYAMFIDYNASGEAGKGSCIFLHCIGSKTSTSGCVAIPETAMKLCVKWARTGTKIVIK